MNPSIDVTKRRRQVLIIVLVLVVLFGAYRMWGAIHTRNTTGLLQVTASDKTAVITITEANHEAAAIGTGSASVRVPAGSYLLSAGVKGLAASKAVKIENGQQSKVTLQLQAGAGLPSPDNIQVLDSGALANAGISDAQQIKFRELLFDYKPSMQTFYIDANSMQADAASLTSYSTTYTMLFTGRVDGKAVRGEVTNVDFGAVRLRLVDAQTGAQLYSGDSANLGTD